MGATNVGLCDGGKVISWKLDVGMWVGLRVALKVGSRRIGAEGWLEGEDEGMLVGRTLGWLVGTLVGIALVTLGGRKGIGRSVPVGRRVGCGVIS